MAGLYHSLNVGADALMATRQGVDTAGHNIANAHTEGFSRQRIELTQREPSQSRGVLIGNGVFVKNITRAHDRFLEKHLNTAHQDTGYSNTFADQMTAVEAVYSPELNASVADEMTAFFSSLQDMSGMPEDLSVRTAVKERAQSLIQSFKRVDESLRTQQYDLNEKIHGEVEEVNGLLRDIARLNININVLEGGEQRMANDLRDQQDRLIRQLSDKMEVHYYRGDLGQVVLRGPDEALLVERGNTSQLGTVVDSDNGNFYDIVFTNVEGGMTRSLARLNQGGSLRALVEVRDDVVQGLLEKNNHHARSFMDHFNHIHRKGYGINAFKEVTGRDFFTTTGDFSQTVQGMKISDVIAGSTDAIGAAATPGAPGDNVVLNELIRLQGKKLLSDNNATFTDYYANYVGVFGLEVLRAQHSREADQILLADLQSRKESISGVSLDEEAMNLLRWQANFTASSRVISVVDEMLETVLGLKR